MSKFTKILSVIALAGAVALVAADTADAQSRRGGGGGRVVVRRGGPTRVIVARPYYNPYFYGGWGYGGWGPGWYGSPFYGGWYGYPGGFGYPGFGYGGYYRTGEVRIQAEPRQTEVFVDGYYAGIVDDFDGAFQRLRVEPGEHEIQLYLEGYRSFHQNVYVQPNKTFRIKETLEPLGPGDTAEPRPVAPPPPPEVQNGNSGPNTRQAPNAPPPQGRRRAPGSDLRVSGDAGSLALRVQPANAEIFVDGEPWQGTGGERLVIQVSAGEHRIEVRLQGYATFQSTVRVRPGDTTPVNVSLTKQ